MKKTNLNLVLWSVMIMTMLVISSCDETKDPVPDPVAGYTFKLDGKKVTFTNTSTNAISYTWDFGDDKGTSTETNPVYTYTTAGTFEIKLVATNTNNVTNTFKASVVIKGADPIASFVGIIDGKKVTFTNTSTNAVSYAWDFGDNKGTSTETNPVYTYSDFGTFEVKLIATNTDNVKNTTTAVFIFDAPFPTADFSYMIEEMNVTFTNTSINAVSFSWDFGDDSAESTETNPVHTYTVANEYFVTLTATNANGIKSIFAAILVIEVPTTITPTELFHTFASAESSANLVYDPNSSTLLTYGEDDPTDATAAKVGKAQRTTAQYSDIKLRSAAPEDAKDIQFDNFTKMSIEVYFPSTNNIAVEKHVAIWFADESFGNFWEDWEFYSNYATTEEDKWLKFEWDLTDRTLSEKDWDIIGVKLGEDASQLDATFFVRNFKFE